MTLPKNSLKAQLDERLKDLQESEERLSLAAESAGAGLWSLDLGSRWYWATRKTRELFGFSPDEVLTFDLFLSLVHPEDRELVIPTVETVVQAKQEGSVEYRIIRSDGSVRWMASRGRVRCTASGKADCLMGVSVDITERKRAEEAAAEQMRFEALLADLSARFVDVPADQLDGEIEDAQRRVCEYLGLELSSLWQCVDETADNYKLTHLYRPVGGPPVPDPMDGQENFPWCQQQLVAGKVITVSSIDQLPPEAARDQEVWRYNGVKTSLTFPLSTGGDLIIGFLSFNDMRAERVWPEAIVKQLQLVAQIFANALARKRLEEELVKSYAEIKQLKEQLQAKNVSLRQDLQLSHVTPHILGRSDALQRVLAAAKQVAATDSTVLLLGETGTGKELIASAIHDQSARRDRPMIRVNCAALPPTLIESELFGREKGAYTGALTRQIGRFEAADRSTLFLDEIGELPPEVQVKLLRFLQERQIERLGSTTPIAVDVRIIAATNCDLQKAIRDGRFRSDLYCRLSVFPITAPPLRKRREDIPLMVQAFADHFATTMGKTVTSISQSNLGALQCYDWPGNVRELRNVVERAMILAHGPKLTVEVPSTGSSTTATLHTMADVERDHILRVLEQTGWLVQGKGSAAEILGLKRSTLQSRMSKLGIRRPIR